MLSKTEWKIFLGLFLLFFTFNTFYEWNTKSIVNTARALAYDNTLQMDSYLNETWTGNYLYIDGHYYTDKPPGMIILTYLPSKVMSFFWTPSTDKEIYFFAIILIAFTSNLFSALTAVLIYRVTGFIKDDENIKILVSVAFGISTIALKNAALLNAQPSGMFFAFLGFYFAYKISTGRERRNDYYLAGLASAFAFIIDFSLMVMLVAYIFSSRKMLRNSWKYILGALFPILILVVYMNILGISSILSSYEGTNLLLFSRGGTEMKDLSSWVFDTNISKLILYFMNNIFIFLFFPDYGIFAYSPILILGAIGLFLFPSDQKKMGLFLILLTSVYISSYAFVSSTECHYGFGCRLIFPIVPFILIGIANIYNRVNIWVFISVIALSTIIALSGLTMSHAQWGGYGMNPFYRGKQLVYDHCLFRYTQNPIMTYYIPTLAVVGTVPYSLEMISPRYILYRYIGKATLLLIGLSLLYISRYKPMHAYRLTSIIIIFFVLLSLAPHTIGYYNKSFREYSTHSLCKQTIVSDSLYPMLGYLGLPPREKNHDSERIYIPNTLWIDPNLNLTIIESRNWKYPDRKFKLSHGSFNNASILVYNYEKNQVDARLTLTHNLREFNSQNKNISISLNGQHIRKIASDRFYRTEQIEIILEPGINMFNFYAPESCTSTQKCESIHYNKIYISSQEPDVLCHFGDNTLQDFYVDTDYNRILLKKDAEIICITKREILHSIRLHIYSFLEDRNVQFYLNGEPVLETEIYKHEINPKRFEIDLSLKAGENKISIHSSGDCRDYSIHDENHCISLISYEIFSNVVSFH